MRKEGSNEEGLGYVTVYYHSQCPYLEGLLMRRVDLRSRTNE